MPTVLVIEDDSTSADVVSHVLQREGCTVLTTTEPEEAYRFAKDLKIDVVICDVVLRTAVTGTDVALAIRRSYPEIPILFVSGTAFEGWPDADFANLEALLVTGRTDFMMKPFTAQALVRSISRLLQPSFANTSIRSELDSAREFRLKH
jgi:CheY-like chemotaxis protein